MKVEKHTQFHPDSLMYLVFMNQQLAFKKFIRLFFMPIYFSGSCSSEGRVWLQEPDVGWAVSLCANTRSFMYWQMAAPHITTAVPTCLIGRELVNNIFSLLRFWNAFLIFSWLTFRYVELNKWRNQIAFYLNKGVCLVRAWLIISLRKLSGWLTCRRSYTDLRFF